MAQTITLLLRSRYENRGYIYTVEEDSSHSTVGQEFRGIDRLLDYWRGRGWSLLSLEHLERSRPNGRYRLVLIPRP